MTSQLFAGKTIRGWEWVRLCCATLLMWQQGWDTVRSFSTDIPIITRDSGSGEQAGMVSYPQMVAAVETRNTDFAVIGVHEKRNIVA